MASILSRPQCVNALKGMNALMSHYSVLRSKLRHITTSTCRVEARAVSKWPLCCRGHMHFPEIFVFFILNDNSLKFVPNGPIHKLASMLRHCPTQWWQMQRFRCTGSLHRRPYHKLHCIPWFSVLRSHRQDFAVNKVTMFCNCFLSA